MKLSLVVCTVVIAGCAPTLGGYTVHHRKYDPGEYARSSPQAKPAEGSLFSEATGGYLEDTRAVRVGDVVVVKIDEAADAASGATTQTQRDSTTTIGAPNVLGMMPALQRAYPGLDPTKLLDLASHSGFNGTGNTQRKGQLNGTMAVRVNKEMPNGDLYIEGTKVVLINNEEYHIYISGLCRPADIGQDNTISSSRIADAQVEFSGRGDMSDQQRRGWLARIIDQVNPF